MGKDVFGKCDVDYCNREVERVPINRCVRCKKFFCGAHILIDERGMICKRCYAAIG